MALLEILQQIQEMEISEMFRILPDQDEYPDYYQVIEHPIALREMQEKSGTDYSLQDLKLDFELMIQNAFKYNRKGSLVYSNAQKLESVFNELFEVAHFQQQILDAIADLKDKVDQESFKALEDSIKITKIKTAQELESAIDNLGLKTNQVAIVKNRLESLISSDIYVDPESSANVGEPLDELQVKGITFRIGDFAYVKNSKIVQIFEIWKNADGFFIVN